jgi:DNA topoisomerase I
MSATTQDLHTETAVAVVNAAALHPAGVELAAQASLLYINNDCPGIARIRRGRGYSYRCADGTTVQDGVVLDRIRKLVIPPAWTQVWICADASGHIQATGRDERGRKQYIYHPEWAAIRDQVKYDRMLHFAEALPALRAHVNEDLRRRTLSLEKVAAIAVQLLDKARIRIGNPEYQRSNETYGLTTLQDQHAAIEGDRLTLIFKGKSAKQHTIELRDRRLARLVRACQDLPGQELFQYVDPEGAIHALRSNDVNAYLRSATGQDFTAKDFRTWGGTVAAAHALYEIGRAETQTAQKRNLAQAIRCAAEILGNTVTVCRKYYVHPAVVAAYADGSLFSTMEQAAANCAPGLDPEETAVRQLLRIGAAQMNSPAGEDGS